MDITVSYHETTAKLQDLSHHARGPFDRSEWFALLERHGYRPLIARADGPGGTAALVLMPTAGGLESLANWFSFTWRPLAGEGAPADAALASIARSLRERSQRVELAPLPEEDGSAIRLERAFRNAGWAVFRQQSDDNHVLAVDGRSFAEYWATRPGAMRTTLKRKRGRVAIALHSEFSEEVWDAYRHVYAASWKPAEERADLLEAFARAEGAAGRLRMGIAYAGDEPVAAQFWTVEAGTAYIHKLAHVEAAKPLSAGTTLTAALFEQAIDRDRVDLIDFGTGTDGYKRDWMEMVRPRYRLICLDPRQVRAWPELVRMTLRRLAPHRGRG